MKKFIHFNASTVDEAVSRLERYDKEASVGGNICQDIRLL